MKETPPTITTGVLAKITGGSVVVVGALVADASVVVVGEPVADGPVVMIGPMTAEGSEVVVGALVANGPVVMVGLASGFEFTDEPVQPANARNATNKRATSEGIRF